MTADVTNGFRLKGLNADCDRLAVQSTHETTWVVGRTKLFARGHDVGLAQNELKVLRAYGGAPVIEIEALGGPHGTLIVERSRGATRVLRNGARCRLELGTDESVVLKTEHWRSPRGDGAQTAQV